MLGRKQSLQGSRYRASYLWRVHGVCPWHWVWFAGPWTLQDFWFAPLTGPACSYHLGKPSSSHRCCWKQSSECGFQVASIDTSGSSVALVVQHNSKTHALWRTQLSGGSRQALQYCHGTKHAWRTKFGHLCRDVCFSSSHEQNPCEEQRAVLTNLPPLTSSHGTRSPFHGVIPPVFSHLQVFFSLGVRSGGSITTRADTLLLSERLWIVADATHECYSPAMHLTLTYIQPDEPLCLVFQNEDCQPSWTSPVFLNIPLGCPFGFKVTMMTLVQDFPW
jgi:hypothetical protein